MPNDHIASDEVGRKRVLNDKNDDANRKSAYTYSQSNRAPQLQPDDILLPNSEDAHEYLNNTELIDRLATGKRIGNDSRIFNYPSYNNNDGCSSNTVVKMECIVDEESGSSCKLQGIQEELLGRTNNDVVQVEEERPEDIKKIQKEY